MASSFKYNHLQEDVDLIDMSNASASPHETRAMSGAQQAYSSSIPTIPQGQMNSNDAGGMSAFSSAPIGGSNDGTAQGALNPIIPSFLRNAAHPYVCLFHILFKALAIFTYWIIYAITKDIIFTFILTTIFLAVDFWTVKNVTGRILVGLRWWNKMNHDGTSEWMFESGVDRSQVSSLDKNVFWIVIYVFPLFWIGAAISNLLSFSPNFVVLNLMGIAFAGTNALGYTKCSRSGQQAVTNWATNQAMKVITGNVIQNIASSSQV